MEVSKLVEANAVAEKIKMAEKEQKDLQLAIESGQIPASLIEHKHIHEVFTNEEREKFRAMVINNLIDLYKMKMKELEAEFAAI